MLIPVKYHTKNYPTHIKPELDEIAGHFDVQRISPSRNFSLHTEYSYGKRKFDSELIKDFPSLRSANKNGVPQLWYSEQWAIEFAEFIKLLCNGMKPTIIEIHPPFSDYTQSIDSFVEIYQRFEKLILNNSPETKIFIENRSGSIYQGGTFIISRGKHLRILCDSITDKKLQLRITLDIPQLLTSYGGPQNLSPESLANILDKQMGLQSMVDGIHLWGKKKSASGRWVSHSGDLNTYFESEEKKSILLDWLVKFLGDGRNRYFVPEVNGSNEDLFSIVSDLEGRGIKFG